MEEDCAEAIERYEAEEAADKEVTGRHTPLILQKAMVPMAPVGGWDMVGPFKYGRKANDKPSEDADESDSSEHSDEDSDFEAEKAPKAKRSLGAVGPSPKVERVREGASEV